MWVKICANTNVDDALEAARLGADAVGFVFAPSTRQVRAAEVQTIVVQLPATLEKVGVFGAIPPDEICRIATEAHLTAVQLHGGFDRTQTEAVRACLDPSIDIIQVIHWQVDDPTAAAQVKQTLQQVAAWSPESRVLIDAKVGKASGGTGRTFDWVRAREVLAGHGALRVIVAGGLRPENVTEAIATLTPWGIDVASGVEREPGRKDFTRLRDFLDQAKSERTVSSYESRVKASPLETLN